MVSAGRSFITRNARPARCAVTSVTALTTIRFWNPGLQDITAWVDFTRLAAAAVEAGLHVSGYCTQAAYLLGAGITAELAASPNAQQRARHASQARQLLMPGEMGETFKAMLLTRGELAAGGAFAVQDLRRLL